MLPCYSVQLIAMLSAIKFGYSSITDETLCSTRNTKVPLYQNIKYLLNCIKQSTQLQNYSI